MSALSSYRDSISFFLLVFSLGDTGDVYNHTHTCNKLEMKEEERYKIAIAFIAESIKLFALHYNFSLHF